MVISMFVQQILEEKFDEFFHLFKQDVFLKEVIGLAKTRLKEFVKSVVEKFQTLNIKEGYRLFFDCIKGLFTDIKSRFMPDEAANKILHLEKTCSALETELNGSKKENKTLRMDLEECELQKKSIRSDSIKELDALRRENIELKRKNAQLLEDYQCEHDKWKSLQQSFDALNKLEEELRSKNEHLTKKVQCISRDLETSKNDYESLNLLYESTRQQLEESEKRHELSE